MEASPTPPHARHRGHHQRRSAARRPTSARCPSWLRGIIGVWAAAALPMGLLAWVVAPLARRSV